MLTEIQITQVREFINNHLNAIKINAVRVTVSDTVIRVTYENKSSKVDDEACARFDKLADLYECVYRFLQELKVKLVTHSGNSLVVAVITSNSLTLDFVDRS